MLTARMAKERSIQQIYSKTTEPIDFVMVYINEKVEEGKFVLKVSKSNNDQLISFISRCEDLLKLLGYRVVENGWEVRIEWE